MPANSQHENAQTVAMQPRTLILRHPGMQEGKKQSQHLFKPIRNPILQFLRRAGEAQMGTTQEEFDRLQAA